MQTIFKYEIPIQQEASSHAIPLDGKFLHVGMQPGYDNNIMVWVEVDTDKPAPFYYVVFKVIGTGHPRPENAEHVGTVQDPDGFVWHVYRRINQ